MNIFYIIAVLAGIGGIVASAITQNWASLIWAIAATLWTIKAWVSEKERND